MSSHGVLADGASRRIGHEPGVVALDGVREIVLTGSKLRRVRYSRVGPRVVNREHFDCLVKSKICLM